ncbi:MAG: hotdog fold thioesterase [Bacteroidia bacterium]|nr:hotdog fold thioesterase [Bacteroidia bacterium]
MNSALEIVYSEIGDNYLCATMPVNHNTVQPLRMLNGGASLALVECVGSMAANLALDREKFVAVGQSVTGNHFKPAFEGDMVTAKAMPLHIGKRSQIWEVCITDGKGVAVSKGTITMAVIPLDSLRG